MRSVWLGQPDISGPVWDVSYPGKSRETESRKIIIANFWPNSTYFSKILISDFGIMANEIRDDRIDHATKVVSTHMKQQNPFYAQLECMMKVVPAPSVSLPTTVFRQLEGNARIVVLDWNAQGEILVNKNGNGLVKRPLTFFNTLSE